MSTPGHNAKVMNRLALTKRLVAQLKREEAVIGGIGNSNFDLWASGQRPQNFYMLGSMGLAVPIGLGVAIAQPQRKVFVLEGDGSLLMNVGCLATVGLLAEDQTGRSLWDVEDEEFAAALERFAADMARREANNADKRN